MKQGNVELLTKIFMQNSKNFIFPSLGYNSVLVKEISHLHLTVHKRNVMQLCWPCEFWLEYNNTMNYNI